MKQKLYLKEIRGGITNKNIELLSNVIFQNFKYLTHQSVVQHNLEYIYGLLYSENMYSIFVYDDKKTIIGYLIGGTTMMGESNIVFFLSYMYVSPKYRNNGIGTQMMNTLKKHVRDSDITNIVLVANMKNPKVVNFFMNNHGFNLDPTNTTGQQFEILVKHNHYKDL